MYQLNSVGSRNLTNSGEIALDFLVRECKQGNGAAQKKIFEMYAGNLYGSAYRITGNTMDAQDVIQESFVDAFEKIDSFRSDGTLGSWLKRIVINKSLNHIKKRKQVFEPVETIEMVEQNLDDYEEPEYTIEMVKKAMEELAEGYKVIFSLFAFEGYSHKQIADELGIAESTSKSQYNRAKTRIKELVIKQQQHG